MNVLYTCDNNYIWLMGISTISLFENNMEVNEIEVYLLGEDISNDNRNILSSIGEKYGRKITVIDVPKFNIPETVVSARWPLSAFTRLFSGGLLSTDIHRILYLDCDTIICGKISELQDWDMGGKTFCGVKDSIGILYKTNIGMPKEKPYINAGVLLIDLDRLRYINMFDSINNFMIRYGNAISYADQDILNGIFYDEIGYLHPKYDVMTIEFVHTYKEIQKLRRPTGFYTESEIKEAIAAPDIIHYTTNMRVIRPWFSNSDHPCASVFYKYMRISPWKDKVLSEMVFTSKESQIIGMILKLPKKIAYSFLGIIHSYLKPGYKKVKVKSK